MTAPRAHSAMSEVARSGFDLTPTRRRKGKLATIARIAKADIEPFKCPPGMGANELVPAPGMIDRLGFCARMAFALMKQSKPEFVALFERMGLEDADQLMTELFRASEDLKSMAHMVEMAQARLIVAASAAAQGERKAPRRKAKKPSAKRV